jgi:CheY-like chemotaxis protein
MRFSPPRKTGGRLSLYSSAYAASKIDNSPGRAESHERERVKTMKADSADFGKDHEDMKSILIIDDDSGIRECLGDAVNRCGYRPVPYADGASALSLLASGEHIDAAIVDLIMPGMDGFEFLAHAHGIAPQLPCIVLSGDISIEHYLKAMQLGAIEYLSKPFRIRDLGRVLISVTNKCATSSVPGKELFQRGEWRAREGKGNFPSLGSLLGRELRKTGYLIPEEQGFGWE